MYYALEANKNLVDMKSITDKHCTATFDEDEVVIRNKSTGKALIRQRSINRLYPVSLEDLLELGDEPSAAAAAAVAVEELPADHQRILWHRRQGHVHNDKLIESDGRGLVEGINLDKKYFRKKYQEAICKCNTCLWSKLARKNFRTPRPVISMDGNPRERGVVSDVTTEVLNTPSMEGYKHVLVLKHSDAKKV